MRLTAKGRVTIPVAVRDRLGLRADDEVEFVVEGDSVRLVRARNTRPVVGGVPMSTDEIMALTRHGRASTPEG